jgi:hypothetical protein
MPRFLWQTESQDLRLFPNELQTHPTWSPTARSCPSMGRPSSRFRDLGKSELNEQDLAVRD